jgi:ribonuclease P protein component
VKVEQGTQTNSQGSFPKHHRLLRHADFERVYKQGRRHFAAHMTVFYLRRPNDESNGARVGFTVSKALGGAVQRNRIRRRLREAVRLGNSPTAVAVDVVINPKRSALTVDFGDLQAEIAKAFQVIEKHMLKGSPQ